MRDACIDQLKQGGDAASEARGSQSSRIVSKTPAGCEPETRRSESPAQRGANVFAT